MVLAAGADASGMATMVGDLLERNLHDSVSRRRLGALARGEVILRDYEHDLSVTLSFEPGRVVISEGPAPHAPEVSAPWLVMAQLSSGRLSPFRALARHELRIRPRGRPGLVAALAYLLVEPPEKRTEERRTRMLALVLAVTAAGVVTRRVALGHRSTRRVAKR